MGRCFLLKRRRRRRKRGRNIIRVVVSLINSLDHSPRTRSRVSASFRKCPISTWGGYRSGYPSKRLRSDCTTPLNKRQWKSWMEEVGRRHWLKNSFPTHGPRPSLLVEHGTVPHRVEHGDNLGPPLHAHEIFASWAEYSIHIVLKSIFPSFFFFFLRPFSLVPLD